MTDFEKAIENAKPRPRQTFWTRLIEKLENGEINPGIVLVILFVMAICLILSAALTERLFTEHNAARLDALYAQENGE